MQRGLHGNSPAVGNAIEAVSQRGASAVLESFYILPLGKGRAPLKKIELLNSLLEPADALLIVPPFASIDRTCLAVHLLQSCARSIGFSVDIFYANLLMASIMGEANYYALYYSGLGREMLGERLFCRTANGMPPFGENGLCALERRITQLKKKGVNVDVETIMKVEGELEDLCDAIALQISVKSYPVIGFTNAFDQISACIALIRSLRKHTQSMCIMGGSNCLGEMAEGIVALCPEIDFIFTGEAEKSFPTFLDSVKSDSLASLPRIIAQDQHTPIRTLPAVTYDEFFAQAEFFLEKRKLGVEWKPFIQYETSRGCWKGASKPCNFCGLNGDSFTYREKETETVMKELRSLVSRHPTQRIAMADCVIPPRHFDSLLKRLSDEGLGLQMSYAVRPNIGREDMLLMKKSGVRFIQPGIESLSTTHLEKMNKGAIASDNLRFLKNAKELGLQVHWYIIHDIPGETLEELLEIQRVIPLIEHLEPPRGFVALRLDRFSPFFDRRENFGIEGIAPWSVYNDIFPQGSPIKKIACHFDADYVSASRDYPMIVTELVNLVEAWRASYYSGAEKRARLEVQQISSNLYLLIDTRGISVTPEPRILDRATARLVLFGCNCEGSKSYSATNIEWAREHGLLVEVDQFLFPLANASDAVKRELSGKQEAY